MQVIEFINTRDILVKFENGYFKRTIWDSFVKGEVKNPYDKTIYGVGYLGEGKYKSALNGSKTIQYNTWQNMLERCYNSKFHTKRPSYRGCTVIDVWHNFQNFAAWFDENYYEVEGQKMHLDKDILIKGNKLYSPDTCVFVPKRMNVLFVKNDSTRGNFPIGVTYNKKLDKYIGKCSVGGGEKPKHLGCHSTIEEAFQEYKTFKEKLIKQIAEEYKDGIPEKLYSALLSYEIEIND